ncbi:hypothetical protein GGU10DRAFT_390406 [Lentinula aff. detonsa]|uniref:Uncharacterized protein n=1 Tax=Lentinula aff. detonsa TaxID=2804958 RepID=A0AA38KCH2_9AGAR|nr:hypothetical protein GGU10DRAFT_390406 [Lentinula aff. detonsa]
MSALLEAPEISMSLLLPHTCTALLVSSDFATQITLPNEITADIIRLQGEENIKSRKEFEEATSKTQSVMPREVQSSPPQSRGGDAFSPQREPSNHLHSSRQPPGPRISPQDALKKIGSYSKGIDEYSHLQGEDRANNDHDSPAPAKD